MNSHHLPLGLALIIAATMFMVGYYLGHVHGTRLALAVLH